MARVLVVEDEDIIRNNVLRILRAEGFDAYGAANGKQGLNLAQSLVPDVVICDINMPVMDGFALLDALRAEQATRGVPFIFLTAQDDRATFRKGMSLGADDFIPKPFLRNELLDAVNSRIKRKEQTASTTDTGQLHRHFADLYAGKPSQLPFDLQAATDTRTGALLCVELKNILELAKKLSSAETSHLLQEFFRQAANAALLHGAEHVTFYGTGLLASFAEPPNATASSVVASCRNALIAASKTHELDAALIAWVNDRFRLRGLDSPQLNAVVHAGKVGVFQVSAVGVAARSEVCETVLEVHAAARSGPARVLVSDAVVARAGTGFEFGEVVSNTLVDGRAFRVRALKAASAWALREAQAGAAPRAGTPVLSSATVVCIEENARLATLALQEVLTAFTPPLTSALDPTLEGAPSFKGYRLLRRIGQGGMSRVFLAERESDRQLVAMKVLDLQTQPTASTLATNQIDRFVQEYALVSRVTHPNVVRIFDQGFTDDHAYIAMEYFEGGDVKQLVKSLEDKSTADRRQRAYEVLQQAASALVAVHEEGITHRDIKPENLMFRSSGSLALVDFGIAKDTQNVTLTQHGFIVGTPLYLSPEQACGKPATPQSDLYSLGVIFYELLTCKLPFGGESVQAILAQHMIAPVPRLPAELAGAQPLIDWLLAKDAAHRCPRAAALVERLRG